MTEEKQNSELENIAWAKVGAKGHSIESYQVLQKLNAEEREKIKADYKEWTSKIAVAIPTYLFVIIGAVGGLFFFFSHGMIKNIAIVAFLYALIEIFKRECHREGYFDGYRFGFEKGIDRVFGLSDEESIVFQRWAREVEFHSKH